MRRLAGALALVCLTGCSAIVGTHPFSSLPKSSGKIDTTPRVLIVRGQGPVFCRQGDYTPLVFFFHLQFMPEQAAWVSANGGPEHELFGNQFTIRVKAKSPTGFLSYHRVLLRLESRTYEVSTAVADCGLRNTN